MCHGCPKALHFLFGPLRHVFIHSSLALAPVVAAAAVAVAVALIIAIVLVIATTTPGTKRGRWRYNPHLGRGPHNIAQSQVAGAKIEAAAAVSVTLLSIG